MRYRKKPVEIEALQWTGINKEELIALFDFDQVSVIFADDVLTIRTLEGDMRADIGDWIIRGVKGEFYPCKPDIFEATYEPVDPREQIERAVLG